MTKTTRGVNPVSAPLLADALTETARAIIADHGIIQSVRPAFALALKALEREGLIPGEAPELREVGESRVLAELREWLEGEIVDCNHDAYRLAEMAPSERPEGETFEGIHGRQGAIEEVLDRIAAKTPPAQPAADRFRAALKAHGVDLGADALAAVLRALAAMDEAPQ